MADLTGMSDEELVRGVIALAQGPKIKAYTEVRAELLDRLKRGRLDTARLDAWEWTLVTQNPGVEWFIDEGGRLLPTTVEQGFVALRGVVDSRFGTGERGEGQC